MAGLIPAVDLALRGGAAVLLALLAGLLARDYGRVWAARLGALFALGVAVFAVCSASRFAADRSLWRVAILALTTGNNVVFWLFARALFDDGFRPRAWQGALWAGFVGVALTCALILKPAYSPLAAPVDDGLELAALAVAALAVVQTFSSWSADLVERRRRLRVAVVAACAGYIVLTALAALLGARDAAPEAVSLASAAGLFVIAAGVAWSFLGVAGGEALFALPGAAAATTPVPVLDGADRELLSALEHAMTFDRVYRQEGITIGRLAHMHGTPEHRLRRLINQGLGHRNFNSFLNGYRIADAKESLADRSQAQVPILTIALDAGFNSLGPFNRAFRLETGTTPSEFRRQAGGGAQDGPPISLSAGRIRKSA